MKKVKDCAKDDIYIKCFEAEDVFYCWLGCFGPKFSVSLDTVAHELALACYLNKYGEDYILKLDRVLESLKSYSSSK